MPSQSAALTTAVGVAGMLFVMLFILFGVGIETTTFYSFDALVIVTAGLAASALIAFRGQQISAAWASLRGIFREDPPPAGEIEQLCAFADAVRRNVRDAEKVAEQTRTPFLRLGMQLVLENASMQDIHHVLNFRIQKTLEKEQGQARLFRTLAELSPAYGLLATVIGLIGMMGGLGSEDMSVIGGQLALALTSTMYGVLLANLVFRPVSIKLEQKTASRVEMLNVLLEGVVLVRMGRGPVALRETMEAFVREYRDELHG